MKGFFISISVVALIGVLAYYNVDYKEKMKPKNPPKIIHAPFGSSSKDYPEEDVQKMRDRLEEFNKNKERPKMTK